MRELFGWGTPREAASARNALLFVIQTEVAMLIVIVADIAGELAMLTVVATTGVD